MRLLTGGPTAGPDKNRLAFTGCGRGLVSSATFRPAVGWALDRPAAPTVLRPFRSNSPVAATADGGVLVGVRAVHRVWPTAAGWTSEPVAVPAEDGAEEVSGLAAGPGGMVAVVECLRSRDPKFFGRSLVRLGPGGWVERMPDGFSYWSVVVLPDGERVVTDEFDIRRSNDDVGGLTVRRLSDGATLARFPGPHRIDMRLAGLPDGRVIGTAGSQLVVWQLDGPPRPPELVPTGRGQLRDVAAHPGGRLLAAVRGASVVLFDTGSWRVVETFDPGIGRLVAVASSPDGLLWAAAGTRGRVAVWDADH